MPTSSSPTGARRGSPTGALLFFVAVVACAVLPGACTALLNFSTSQCDTDTQCNALGPGLTCQRGSCVNLTAALGTGGTAGSSGASGAGGAAGASACTTNAECTSRNGGEPSLCIKPEARCTAPTLLSVCPFLLPTPTNEVLNEDAVVFGVFLPVQGAAPLADPKALAYNLALNELHLAGGLRIGGKRTPFAAVVCDSDPKVAEQGLTHLINTLHVPAIVSLFSQDNMTRFADPITKGTVFTVNPFDATEALKGVDTKRLIWNLLGSPEDIAVAYKPLVLRAEPYVRQQLGNPPGNLRVAVVTASGATEKAMSTVIRDKTKGIVVNGLPFQDNAATDRLAYPITSIDEDPTHNYAADVTAIAAFRPHLVVLLSGGEEGQIVPGLDKALSKASAPLPFYVLGPRGNADPGLLTYLGNAEVSSADAKRRRVVGVEYASATDLTQRDAYVQRMSDMWRALDLGNGVYASVDNSYDAIYWVAYAAAAAGPGRATGLELAAGARKLLAGPNAYAGSVAAISQAALDIGNSTTGVTFVGALGVPDIDVTTGTWRRNGSIYCPTEVSPGVVDMRYDVLRYDPVDGKLKGNFDCFVGF